MDRAQQARIKNGFKKGRKKTGGRIKGVLPQMPKLLKDAVMMAAELEGSDRRGKDGLIGFLRKASRRNLQAYLSLMARVMPLEINEQKDVHVEVIYHSVAEVRRELASRGIDAELVAKIMYEPPTIEHEEMVETETPQHTGR